MLVVLFKRTTALGLFIKILQRPSACYFYVRESKEEGKRYRTYLRRFVRRCRTFFQGILRCSRRNGCQIVFYLWICQNSQRAMPYFTTALSLLFFRKPSGTREAQMEQASASWNARSAIGTPAGLWTEEWTERKNVRFISVHAVNLKKFFSASSLMFIAFSAMSRNFFCRFIGSVLAWEYGSSNFAP